MKEQPENKMSMDQMYSLLKGVGVNTACRFSLDCISECLASYGDIFRLDCKNCKEKPTE